MSRRSVTLGDTLYGNVQFDARLSTLIARPIVQRLRHVRLSNIDSVALPGIADLSRYEHVLGVCHLVSHLGFSNRLSTEDKTALEAAALLHDWAISPYGHLVEEAFAYAGKAFDHEDKLFELIERDTAEEPGGISRQLFLGRETGLESWAREIFGPGRAAQCLRDITDWIRGRGRFGKVIASEMDLDNLDNVARIAFHMGLPVDRKLAVRIAASIIEISPKDNLPVFRADSIDDVRAWLDLRSAVYTKLMLAEPDFAMKIMVLYATIQSIRRNEIAIGDWNLTDRELVARLLASESRDCRETATRWLSGEYWETTPLWWVQGERPKYASLLSFSESLTRSLDRECLAYGIKDKRKRQVTIHVAGTDAIELGSTANQWLFGVGSAARRPFTARENETIIDRLQQTFDCQVLAIANEGTADSEQMCLL